MKLIRGVARLIYNLIAYTLKIYGFFLKAIVRVFQWWVGKIQNSGSRNGSLAWLFGGIFACILLLLPGLMLDSASESEQSQVSSAVNVITAESSEFRNSSDVSESLVEDFYETPRPVETQEPAKLNTPTSIATEPRPTQTNTNTPQPTRTRRPTETPPPSATPLPQGVALISDVNGQEVVGEEATVNYVVDGDTVNVILNGSEFRVRYIGMDTPEQGEPFYEDASRANQRLVEGQTVVMVKDVSETDRYGRLLRYVYLSDGTMVNGELVRLGFAQTATYPPDVKHQDLFLELQQEARNNGRGLWGQPVATNTPFPLATNTLAPLPTSTLAPLPTSPAVPAVTDTPVPVPQPTSPPPSGNCDPSYPDVCIAPPPPDLDCGDIPYRRFRVLQPDPHGFDRDKDGIGCES